MFKNNVFVSKKEIEEFGIIEVEIKAILNMNNPKDRNLFYHIDSIKIYEHNKDLKIFKFSTVTHSYVEINSDIKPVRLCSLEDIIAVYPNIELRECLLNAVTDSWLTDKPVL